MERHVRHICSLGVQQCNTRDVRETFLTSEKSDPVWPFTHVQGPKPMPELNFGSRQDRLEYVAFAGALLREFLLQSEKKMKKTTRRSRMNSSCLAAGRAHFNRAAAGETSYNAASHPGAQQSEAQRLNEGATQPDGAGAPDAWTGEQPAAQAPDAPAAAPAAKKVKGIRVGQWRKAATPEGEVYWYHAGTRETRWETPEFTEAELSELAAAEAVAAAAEHSRQLLLEQHEQEQEQAAQQQREEHGRERSEGAAGARPSNGDAAADGAADAGADGDARAAAAAAAAEEASSTVLAPVEPAKPAPGWYYADYAGNIQGPFSVEQMQSWRGHLPMEIPVWRVAEADTDAGYESSAADSLANVLGDSQLLADLRRGLLYPLPSNATAVQAEQQRGMLAARAADPSTWAAAYSAGQTEEERARAALLAATVGVAAEPRGMGAASSSGAWAEAGSGRREEAEDGGDNGGGFSAADLAVCGAASRAALGHFTSHVPHARRPTHRFTHQCSMATSGE